MSDDDSRDRRVPPAVPDRAMAVWSHGDTPLDTAAIVARAAEQGDSRLLAPALAHDLQLMANAQLPSHAEAIRALPPSVVKDAVLAFLAARTDQDEGRTAAAARAAVDGLAEDDVVLAATFAVAIATILVDRARWAESSWFVEAAERTIDIARAQDAEPDVIESLWFGMMTVAVLVEWNTYDGSRRLDALSAALAVPRARNLLRSHHGPPLVAMGYVLGARGDFGAGAVSIARGIPLLPPRSHMRASAQARLAFAKFRQGDWQGARRAVSLVADADGSGGPWARSLISAVDALEPATGGDLAVAAIRIEEATRAIAQHPSVQASMILLHARFALAIGAKDWSGMLQLLDDAEEPGYRRMYTDHEWRALRGMALRNLGRFERYRELVEAWRDEPGARENPYYWAHAAMLSQIDRDGSSALAAVRRAADALSDVEDPLGRTWVRLVVGTIVSLYGDATAGMESYEAARAELSAMGAHGFVRLCTMIIEGTAAHLARASGDPFTALTEQQRRVAELVADGYTSAEIAQILYLSKKTIDFHVANILSRLGLGSRRELARLMNGGHTSG